MTECVLEACGLCKAIIMYNVSQKEVSLAMPDFNFKLACTGPGDTIIAADIGGTLAQMQWYHDGFSLCKKLPLGPNRFLNPLGLCYISSMNTVVVSTDQLLEAFHLSDGSPAWAYPCPNFYPSGICSDASGRLYLPMHKPHVVRVLDTSVSTQEARVEGPTRTRQFTGSSDSSTTTEQAAAQKGDMESSAPSSPHTLEDPYSPASASALQGVVFSTQEVGVVVQHVLDIRAPALTLVRCHGDPPTLFAVEYGDVFQAELGQVRFEDSAGKITRWKPVKFT